MQQLPTAVGTKLIQNDQRNNAQEGTIRELRTAMQKLETQIGNDLKENALTCQKVTEVEKQMACMGKVIEGELSKSCSSVAQSSDAKRHDGTKDEATPPKRTY